MLQWLQYPRNALHTMFLFGIVALERPMGGIAAVVLSLVMCGQCFGQEEFCFPVECLALTVEEVMHIRQVLVKAELEKFQQYKDVYNALKKGKVGTSFISALLQPLRGSIMSAKQSLQSSRLKRFNA